MTTVGPASTDVARAAELLLKLLQAQRYITHAEGLHLVRITVGEELAVIRQDGSHSFHPKVLRAFKRLSGDVAVWDRDLWGWRLREASDTAARTQ